MSIYLSVFDLSIHVLSYQLMFDLSISSSDYKNE